MEQGCLVEMQNNKNIMFVLYEGDMVKGIGLGNL